MMSKPQLTYVMGQLPIQIIESHIKRQQTSRHGYRGMADVDVHVMQPPIIFNLRFDSLKDCPYQPQTDNEREWLTEHLQLSKCFPSSDGQPHKRKHTRLADDEITYLKEMNPAHPNVTLFIHGYNIPFGHFGKQIHAYDKNNNDAMFATYQQVCHRQVILPEQHMYDPNPLLRFCDRDATVFRDVDTIRKNFGEHIGLLKLDDALLNGTGSHNWWLHMEENMNRAAGWEGFDFIPDTTRPSYMRLIHIAWMGDPCNAADYIAVEPMAAITARSLLPLIEQLTHEGIAINIIAHSAGNIVLINLLQLLGVKTEMQECIDNIFMWEAAVPDTVLSPNADKLDTSLNQNWHTQDAYKAVKKIHVLYSLHDNILGPVPINLMGHHDIKFSHKIKSDPTSTLIALSLETTDILLDFKSVPHALESLYKLAHHFSMPVTTMLSSSEARLRCYERWMTHQKRHQRERQQLPTLAKQTAYLKSRYPDTHHSLSLFFTLYGAIHADVTFQTIASKDFLANYFHLGFDIMYPDIMSFLNKIDYTRAHHINENMLNHIDYFSRNQLNHVSIGYLKSPYLYRLYCELLKSKAANAIESVNHHLQLTKAVYEQATRLRLKFGAIKHMNSHLVSPSLYIFDHMRKSLHKWQHDPDIHDVYAGGEEVATLLMTVLLSSEHELRPALGYSGPHWDNASKALRDKKIFPHDQSQYLFSHGAMKNPTNDIFKNVYHDIIIANPEFKFGSYE